MIPLYIARQMARNCLPQCPGDEWESWAYVVYVEEVGEWVDWDCVKRCVDAAKETFRLAAEAPKVVAVETGKKIATIVSKEIRDDSRVIFYTVVVVVIAYIAYSVLRRND